MKSNNDPSKSRPFRCNNGFWDLPPEERAARKEAACRRFGVDDFNDLSPEERGWAYGYDDE